jgi:glyoxylase-like metal-dependent hydrolase (beta-lactamase superfamily II)
VAAKTVRKIVDGFYWIEARQSFLPDANIFLVQDGKKFVLFDAGLENFYPDTCQAISELGLQLDNLDRLILTHTHLDHVMATPRFLQDAKNAKVWLSEVEGKLLEAGDNSIVFPHLLGLPSLPPIPVDRKLRDGDTFEVGAFSFQVLLTPGHSAGSLCFFEPKHQLLISGDVVFRHGSFGRCDLPTGNADQLRQSIARLAELPVEILCPGHMGIALKNGKQEIQFSLNNARRMLF